MCLNQMVDSGVAVIRNSNPVVRDTKIKAYFLRLE